MIGAQPMPPSKRARRSSPAGRRGPVAAPLKAALITWTALGVPACTSGPEDTGDTETEAVALPSGPEAVLVTGALGDRLKAAVSVEELMEHAEGIVRYERPSGSAGENAAIDHIVGTLQDIGVPVQVHAFDAYVSDPVQARVTVVDNGFSPEAITMAYSASADSLVAPVVDVGTLADLPPLELGTGERLVVQGTELEVARDPLDDFPDVEGLIAMVTGQPRNVPTAVLELLGAVGVVFVNPEERLNDLIVTSTWGSPSLRNYHRLPRIPVAQITASAGDSIRQLLRRRSVRLQLSTEVDTGWKQLRLAVARIEPPGVLGAPYVLFGGHIDGWYHGATDEGASNAAMVAIAKAFHAERASLRRGLVVAWWPGHSNGRYAGSTWFADRFGDEMRNRALAYVNVDGIGQRQAARYSAAASAALARVATRVIRSGTGARVTPGRPGTNSDQSFNGVGLPLLQISHNRLEADGGYWWWHTRDDTYDKIDFEILKSDAHLYVDALLELLTAEVYPVDLMAEAAALGDALAERGAESGGRLNLGPAAARHLELTQAFAALQTALRPMPDLDGNLVRVIRPLHRVLYVAGADVHPDPGLSLGPLPGLAPARVLSEERPDSDRFRFARTSLLRERARIVEALDESIELARELTARIRESSE